MAIGMMLGLFAVPIVDVAIGIIASMRMRRHKHEVPEPVEIPDIDRAGAWASILEAQR